jgi:hypothetical protein
LMSPVVAHEYFVGATPTPRAGAVMAQQDRMAEPVGPP